MIPPLDPVGAARGAGSLVVPAPRAAATGSIESAAREFESILVRQLLSAAKLDVGSRSGYGELAIDALSNALVEAGGTGLAQLIAQALAPELKPEPEVPYLDTSPSEGGSEP